MPHLYPHEWAFFIIAGLVVVHGTVALIVIPALLSVIAREEREQPADPKRSLGEQ